MKNEILIINKEKTQLLNNLKKFEEEVKRY